MTSSPLITLASAISSVNTGVAATWASLASWAAKAAPMERHRRSGEEPARDPSSCCADDRSALDLHRLDRRGGRPAVRDEPGKGQEADRHEDIAEPLDSRHQADTEGQEADSEPNTTRHSITVTA